VADVRRWCGQHRGLHNSRQFHRDEPGCEQRRSNHRRAIQLGSETTTTDRAGGFMTSGSYASPNSIMFGFTNSLGSTISLLDLSFNYERYRINTSAASISLFTSTDGSTWTSASAGDSGAFSTGSSTYTFSGGTTVPKSLQLGVNITNGSNFYLRWVFNTIGTNSQGLGLDDFTLGVMLSNAKSLT
jgi:hypothetical protein